MYIKIDINIGFSGKSPVRKYILCYTFIHQIMSNRQICLLLIILWIKVLQSIHFLTGRFPLNTMVLFIFMYNFFFTKVRGTFTTPCVPFYPPLLLSCNITIYSVLRTKTKYKKQLCHDIYLSTLITETFFFVNVIITF